MCAAGAIFLNMKRGTMYTYEFCHFSTKSTTFTFAMIEEFCSEISSNLVVFCSKYDFSVVEFCSKFRISDSVVKFCSKCRFQQLQNSVVFTTEKKGMPARVVTTPVVGS